MAPTGTSQGKAIKEAAEAYIFLQLHVRLRSAYDAFRQAGLEGLTDGQKQYHRGMGVYPDEEQPSMVKKAETASETGEP